MADERLRHHIDHERVIGGLVYRLAKTPEDIKATSQFFFDVFLKDEPGTRALGGYTEFPKSMRDQVEGMVRDGVSLIVEDETTKKLVGIRISVTVEKQDEVPKRTPLADLMSIYPRNWALFNYTGENLVMPQELFRERPGHKKLYDMFALATLPEYRGRGIAKQLVQQAFEVAQKAGCDCAVVIASHVHSRKIFERLDMQVVKEQSWEAEADRTGCGDFRKATTEMSQGLAVHFKSFLDE